MSFNNIIIINLIPDSGIWFWFRLIPESESWFRRFLIPESESGIKNHNSGIRNHDSVRFWFLILIPESGIMIPYNTDYSVRIIYRKGRANVLAD